MFVSLQLFISVSVCTVAAYKIGFLVGEDDQHTKDMIEYAAATNSASNGSVNFTLDFEPILIEVGKTDNTFILGQKVCEVLKHNNLLAIFNTNSLVEDGYLKSTSYHLEMPYIKVAREDNYQPDVPGDSTINFYPMVDVTISTAIKRFKWKSVVLVYSGHSAFTRMVRLSKHLFKHDMHVRLHEVTTDEDLHRMFKTCKKAKWREYGVDLSLTLTDMFLKVALMEGQINENHSFILLNLDTQLLDLAPYQYNGAMIATISLLADTEGNKAILDQMIDYSKSKGKNLFTKPSTLPALSMLTYDSIETFRRAMEDLSYGNNMELKKVTCDNGRTLELGHTIFNYLSMTMWKGLSGSVRLEKGNRGDYSINILQLVENNNLQKIAEYTIVDGAYKQLDSPLPKTRGDKYQSLRVAAIIEEPFLMLARNYETLSGNDRYVGFCADLLAEIARELDFTYEIVVCVNCTYGAPDDHGVWDGMTGELINQKADLALGSFTINYKREQVIDLTTPFMHIGISILYKVPKKETPGLFSFMEPLAIESWFYVILAYILVSVSMYVLGRFSPNEHIKKTVVDETTGAEVVVKEFKLSLVACFWFAVGTLMQQGSEVAPSAISTRVVGGFWWSFALFVISSYTANLAAFLTVEKTITPIQDAEGLSLQTEIQYGTLINGSTWLFFKESNLEPYNRMWEYMSSNPHVFVNSYDEGVERVKKGGYALLMESATLEYKVQKDCDTLMQLGGLLDSKGYGIGTQRDSPWRDLMSGVILKLQESGYINELYENWWKKPGNCNKDSSKGEPGGPHALDVENVGGIFIVLFTGLAVALAVAAVENVYKRKTTRKSSKRFPSNKKSKEAEANGIAHNKSKRPSCVQSQTSSEESGTAEKDNDSSHRLITSKNSQSTSRKQSCVS